MLIYFVGFYTRKTAWHRFVKKNKPAAEHLAAEKII